MKSKITIVKCSTFVVTFIIGQKTIFKHRKLINRYTAEKKVRYTAGVALGRHFAPRNFSALKYF